jgi:hypothetical protein
VATPVRHPGSIDGWSRGVLVVGDRVEPLHHVVSGVGHR